MNEMSYRAPSDYQVYVLPGVLSANSAYYSIYNQAYDLWHEVWDAECKSVNYDSEELHSDDFLRQHSILVLCYKDEMVGLLMSTIYDIAIRQQRDCKFLSYMTDERIEALRARQVQTVRTLEFLTVAPAWRGKRMGFNSGGLVLDLNLKLSKELGVDCSIGAGRKMNKVNDLCVTFGGESWVSEVNKLNFICEIITIFTDKLRPHPDEKLRQLSSALWEKRIYVVDEPNTQKRAA